MNSWKKEKSFNQTKCFIDSTTNYPHNIDINTEAAIALLRRPELSDRGIKLFGEQYSYYNCDFNGYVFNYVDVTLGSEHIVERMQEIEAIIRCSEALQNGMSKEEVFSKFLGFSQDEDTLDNIYFCSRLDFDQKIFISSELDYIFKEDSAILTFLAYEDKEVRRTLTQ